MYDIERLHETYAKPSNDRDSGKTTMNCFNLLGYIDVLNVEEIIVSLPQYNLACGFALRFDTILKEMGFEYGVVKNGLSFIFHVKDCNDKKKKVSITHLDNQDNQGFRGLTHALYYIDDTDINNCYLDLSRSGIPSENNDYSPLIKA